MSLKEYYLNCIIENLKTKIKVFDVNDKSSYELRKLQYALWVASGEKLGTYDREIEDSYND